MMNFHLKTNSAFNVPHIDKWIELAMSRNVENMFLDFNCFYDIPEFFYNSSSIEQLNVKLRVTNMIPRCSVSWMSLKKLSMSFRSCGLSDDTMAKILSGCPILESLTLYICDQLNVLDLSTSQRLRTLEVVRHTCLPGPTEIVAPHIHCLRLRTSRLPCTLVDVSSLTEAKLNIFFTSDKETLQAGFLLQAMVLQILEKLMHVEKLTTGGNFLQMLSLAEIRGLPFPMFKVKDLTLQTSISQYVIPGVERILQNSPDLKKLTLHTRHYIAISNYYFYNHVVLQGLNPDECWRSKDGASWNTSNWNLTSKHVASFVELMLKNTKTLEKIGLQLDESYCRFKELVPTFSHNKNVSIALLTKPVVTSADQW